MNHEGPSTRLAAPRRRYHFHYPGLLYIIITLFVAVGAINSQNNLLFASLGLAIGGLLVSGVLSGAALMGIRLERLPSADASVGAPLALRYRVHNFNRLIPSFALCIEEVVTEEGDFPTTWPGHMKRPRGFAPLVPARGSVQVDAVVEPTRRGRAAFHVVRIWTTFPFGLAKKSVTFHLPFSVTVHPVDLPLANAARRRILARATAGEGAELTPGLGDDFYGLREYADGDNPRWIAWRRSAKTGQLVVRQNTMPSPRRVWFVLDLRKQDGAEAAIALGAALIRAAARDGVAVGIAVPGARIAISPSSSPRVMRAVFESLAVLDSTEVDVTAPFPEGLVRAAGCLVVHAGPVDSSFGSGRSMHITADDIRELVAAGEAGERAIKLLNPVQEDRSSRGLRRAVWPFARRGEGA